MATLIVRRVEQHLVDALKERARRHGRSAEAEHRAILEDQLGATPPSMDELLAYLRRGAELGLDEIELGYTGGGPVLPPTLD
ncbi:MAG: plasmid stability protein [Geminicoccaceae bacterium]